MFHSVRSLRIETDVSLSGSKQPEPINQIRPIPSPAKDGCNYCDWHFRSSASPREFRRHFCRWRRRERGKRESIQIKKRRIYSPFAVEELAIPNSHTSQTPERKPHKTIPARTPHLGGHLENHHREAKHVLKRMLTEKRQASWPVLASFAEAKVHFYSISAPVGIW